MGYINKTKDGRWGLPAGMIALILGLVLFGGLSGPAPALAVTITCGDCHSIPPKKSDNTCNKDTGKNHPSHASSDTSTCTRCHPDAGGMADVGGPGSVHSPTHFNGMINITSPTISPGLAYNKTNSTCTNTCHKNKSTATWGSGIDCNLCHYRSGALGAYQMSGLHANSDRSLATGFTHYSSPIKAVDNTKTITCSNCHPNVNTLSEYTTTHLQHIKTTDFASRGNMSQAFQNVTVTGIGYKKGATKGTGTCSLSCHYNPTDPFGTYTIFFKAGQKKRFGGYSTAKWSDDDLKCNECHSTPSQEATLTGPNGTESANANIRHQAHMFKYKLNPYNYSDGDRNIYCDDCHKTPDINVKRGFRHHSTVGQGGSGVISLPVKSQNAKVFVRFRNNGIGRDKVTLAQFTTVGGVPTCNNIYCHTIITSGAWTEDACNKCHGKKDGVDIGSGAPGFWNLTAFANNTSYEDYRGGGGAHYSHVMKRGYPCRTCHYNGGGDGNPANHHNVSNTVDRTNVNVGVHPDYWFNNQTSSYDWTTRSCNNVKCHFGSSQNWDCAPLH